MEYGNTINRSNEAALISRRKFYYRVSKQELSALVQLALPLVLSALVTMSVSITDVLMMSWLGHQALAAGAVASDFYSIVFYLCAGVVAAISPIMAQHIGAKRLRDARRTMQHGFWVAAAMGVIGLLAVYHSGIFLAWFGVKQQIIADALPYSRWLALAIIPMLGIAVWHSVYAVHHRTKIILFITAITLPVNALGNLIFMFGYWPWPAMGLAGAGLSTLIAGCFSFLLYILFARGEPQLKRYRLLIGWHRLQWFRIKEIFRIGTPIALINFGELGVFMFSTIMMGAIGTTALAAHAVALRCAGVVYAFPFGLAQAATVRVGHAIGAADRNAAATVAGSALLLATLTGVGLLLILVFFSQPLASIILDSATSSTMVAAGTAYLTLLALMQPFDCYASVIGGILRGGKDTKIPMYIIIAGYWGAGFSCAWLLAFAYGFEGIGVWIGLATGCITVSLLMSARMLRHWRKTLNTMVSDTVQTRS